MANCYLRFGSFLPIAVICLLLFSYGSPTMGQSNQPENGFTISFVKPTTSGSVSQVASNVLKVNNNTRRKISYTLDISSPAGWTSLLDRETVFEVAAGDSSFIPVRILPDKNAEGNVSYFVNASAVSTQNIPLASTPWGLEVSRVSRWRATVLENSVYFPAEGDTTSFRVNFTNQGNSAEDLYVVFLPSPKIKVIDRQGNAFAENAFSLHMPVGADTTIRIFARYGEDEKENNFFNSKPMVDREIAEANYKVQVQVRDNSPKSNVSGGTVNLLRIGSVKDIENKEGTASIPINLQFNSYNLLSQFTNFSLDLSGDVEFSEARNLRYYYQTIISSSPLVGTQFLSSYRFLQYNTPKYQASIGNIGDNMELLLNGTGVKGSYSFGKIKVGGIYVTRQQNANLNMQLTNLGARVSYTNKKALQLELEAVDRHDEFNDIHGNLVTSDANLKLPGNQLLRVNAGYSIERHTQSTNPFSTTGFGVGAKYSAKILGVNIASQVRMNSPNYLSQYRGTSSLTLNARYPHKDGQYLGVRVNVNERSPEIYSKGQLFTVRKYKRNYYELQYGLNTESGNYVFYPRIHDDEVLGLRAFTAGGGLLFSSNQSTDVKIFSRFYAGFTKALDYNIDPYLVARWENTLRYKNLNATARYYYGPYNVLDNLRVVEDGITPQSLFFSAYATLNFSKLNMTVRPMINLNYESVLARVRTNFSPVLTYFSKSGFQYAITTEMFSINQGESPLVTANPTENGVYNTYSQTKFMLRFSIKKTFNIKRPGSKVHELEVVVFKDLNGNNVRDEGEDFVPNALITVQDATLMTNEDGSVIFKNLAQGEYKIQSNLITNEEGWFKGDAQSALLDSDKTVFVPLKKGVQVSGNILLQQAQYSALSEEGMDLSGIRVTMNDGRGGTFSSLTDQNGKFYLYVPYGLYTVRVNEQAVDKQFQFAQNSYTININNSKVNYQVTFYLIEKSRSLNIKKFDNKE